MAAMQDALLDWAATAHRDLPWRRTRDPWAVVVSELMLHQTQVARVVPRYELFLRRFPTPAACAAAPVGEVVREWTGLGYNRRAVNLHRAATAVVERHGGRLPADLGGLLELPGIGPYTARAVMAFAHEADVGVLDTNAARVVARTIGRRLAGREAQRRADSLVPAGQGWSWNQAVLDLGAGVCTKRAPRCYRCPVSRWCAWRAAGRPEPDPAVGSAGTTGAQPIFAGSDREGRGRLVRALCQGPVPVGAVGAACGWPDDEDRAARVVGALVAEGLATLDAGVVRLP
ncbi:MAG: A/G-specific adenine glycosylase [Actinomycetota bacterium]|nr:A/G-specific adenine glycosylase [Actinomycetota bacterium]